VAGLPAPTGDALPSGCNSLGITIVRTASGTRAGRRRKPTPTPAGCPFKRSTDVVAERPLRAGQSLVETRRSSAGRLRSWLFTHFGFSGPGRDGRQLACSPLAERRCVIVDLQNWNLNSGFTRTPTSRSTGPRTQAVASAIPKTVGLPEFRNQWVPSRI